jgi:hypothetical protein
MFALQTSFKLPLVRGGGGSVSRGDRKWQGGKLLRLLSQLRLRIRPQICLFPSSLLVGRFTKELFYIPGLQGLGPTIEAPNEESLSTISQKGGAQLI